MIEIVSTVEDSVAGAVLSSAGLDGYWSAHNLVADCNLLKNILWRCCHFGVTATSWDADFPGQNGAMLLVDFDCGGPARNQLRKTLRQLVKKHGIERHASDRRGEERLRGQWASRAAVLAGTVLLVRVDDLGNRDGFAVDRYELILRSQRGRESVV